MTSLGKTRRFLRAGAMVSAREAMRDGRMALSWELDALQKSWKRYGKVHQNERSLHGF